MLNGWSWLPNAVWIEVLAVFPRSRRRILRAGRGFLLGMAMDLSVALVLRSTVVLVVV